MAGLFQNLFGRASLAPTPAPSSTDDTDFADFVGVSEPTAAAGEDPSFGTSQIDARGAVPYTKWYRVWERTSPKDFVQEAFVIPFIVFIILCHLWGTRKNRRKAKVWAEAHVPVLQSEFAVVGYGGVPKGMPVDGVKAEGLVKAPGTSELVAPETVLKENSADEFATYATGRQNVAYVDVSIKLLKRYNPFMLLGEYIIGLFFDAWPKPTERVELIAYAFDGNEKDIVPAPAADKEHPEQRAKDSSSVYDGFIFAIAHKNSMGRLRDERYDVSLTFTKENAKLPTWTIAMSEAAEITEMVLIPDLIKAIEEAGDSFEYLIITDQPVDKPTKIEETTPRKRLQLSLRLPSSLSPAAYMSTLPLFSTFLRLPDRLVSAAHFRPEIVRKLRSTRDDEIKKLKRADEDEKAEERRLATEKSKKEDRDRLLRGMSAEEQRKYLEKEREREQKREMKKATRRG